MHEQLSSERFESLGPELAGFLMVGYVVDETGANPIPAAARLGQ